ncbi:DNA polymerase III subunit beta [Enterobacteriaceae endosymbiont of Neohaemonia nigricornis]|uniref:DNA polymerase III subunit beta n=1 Tax=Enterobacteriaceae endosymbiont of Neohaemonia nigricornis TaxID=2675792 RepID=UPI0014494882|nr:DNA polymerase III subunit beta [Enterobacteriaceae endosymbiont of Neohaemonia nigricornis]QJC30601.1 DNA polymerase III subunit beta [Enterobacteriaceae endosymbiont of Neohaemonia nigricornis]
MEYHIIINREILIKPLKYITHIINNRNISIMQNILVDIKRNGKILFKGSDLEIEIEINIILNNHHNLANYNITIPGKKFYNICRALPKSENINISFFKNKVIISSKTCKYTITTMSSENFPHIMPWKSDISFNLTHNILGKLFSSTIFSIAHNDSREYLNGMFLHIENNILQVISTDGYRLSIYNVNIIISMHNIIYKIIIPRKSIIILLRLLKNTNELVNININMNNISFTIKNLKITSKLINSNYPNYNKIIPEKFLKTIKINKLNFKNALERISILADERTNSVTLIIKKCILKMITKNINNEIAEEILNIEEDNLKYIINISLNIKYLLDVLNVLEHEEIKISFINANSSIKIEDNNDTNKMYLIMPMRI